MKILFLGPSESSLVNFLQNLKNEVVVFEEKLNEEIIKEINPDWVISYGYRHILSNPIIDFVYPKIINLHISLLPWNRGADPNLWSFVDNTPKGVSIHLLTKGVDTGDILVQKEVVFGDIEKQTLGSTYLLLKQEIELLFIKNWEKIKNQELIPFQQSGKGSYHNSIDKNKIVQFIPHGYETKVTQIKNKLNE